MDAKWKHVFQAFIPFINLKDLFLSRCHITANWQMPLFYKNLINLWNQFKIDNEPINGNDVRNEFLWFNDFILIQKKPVFLKQWYQLGIKRVGDLLDNESNFLSQQILYEKYGLQTNFLEYLSIRSAIPVKWKQLLLMEHHKNISDVPVLNIQGKREKLILSTVKNFIGR